MDMLQIINQQIIQYTIATYIFCLILLKHKIGGQMHTSSSCLGLEILVHFVDQLFWFLFSYIN